MTTLVTNPTHIKELCSKIKDSIICVSHANTDDIIITFLKGYDCDMAHPTVEGNIIFKHSGTFYKFVKPSDDVFINNISATDSALTAQNNIKSFRGFANIKRVLGFTDDEIDSLKIEIIEKPIMVSNKCMFFTLTNKGSGQYLDFVAWSRTGETSNYSKKSGFNTSHSGDNLCKSYFAQSIKIEDITKQCEFILGLHGYSKTPLMSKTFTHQNPSMCCYSEADNTVYVFPFQQTEGILGLENTTMASAIVQSDGREMIKITPFTTVPEKTREGSVKTYNTTDSITCNLPIRCFEYADRVSVEEDYDVIEAPIEHIVETISSGIDVPDKSVFQFTTPDAIVFDIENSVVMDYTGNVIDGSSAIHSSKINPSLFSTGKYTKDVFNGSIVPASKPVQNLSTKIDKSQLCVLHFTEDSSKLVTENCAKPITNEMKISCLIVVTMDIPCDDGIIDKLENMKMSFTKFANHCSIILAKSIKTDKYYWIRGIRWNLRSGVNELEEKVYNFGEEFPSSEVYSIITGVKVPYPVRNKTLQYSTVGVGVEEVEGIIDGLDYGKLIERQNDIIELFIQMSSLVPKDTFKQFKTKCLTCLKEKQEHYSKEFKTKLSVVLKKKFDGDDSLELKKEIDALKHKIKSSKANSVLKNLTRTITGITYDGVASTKAASKALDNVLREDLVKGNVSIVKDMTNDDIWNYLEDIDMFIVGQLEEYSSEMLNDMLDKVASNDFTGPEQPIVGFHPTCGELDGCTVAVLSQQIEEKDIQHDLKGVVSMLCGESENRSSIPVAVLHQFTEMDNPLHFKWIDEVNNPDVAKYRLLLRRMVCEATLNRSRSISGGATSLTYFLIAIFISLSQSIKSRISSLPTDKTDFTVIAMRNLVGYIFTMCASGTSPLSNIWQVLSYYPEQVPKINAFEKKDLWILRNLIDMFPYCLWSVAEPNFKKNALCGCVKLLAKDIITSSLDKIGADEKKDMAIKTAEISKDLTTVWQWQKLVIISIMKMVTKKLKKEPYENKIIKHVATHLFESYPDIDEMMISKNHKKSDSSKKLKFILELMMKHGNISLNDHQMKTVKNIISKRMHPYYHTLSKSERSVLFDKLDIGGVYKELGKLVKYEDDGKGPANKYLKSWALSLPKVSPLDESTDLIASKGDTFDMIKDLFSLDVGTSSSASSGSGSDSSGSDSSASTAGAIVVKYPDMREDLWLTMNDVSKMSEFIRGKKLTEVVSILEFVFKGTDVNVYSVIIDIVGILLDEYKDRAKAYDIILRKYKF
jgi:hypothetical protein